MSRALTHGATRGTTRGRVASRLLAAFVAAVLAGGAAWWLLGRGSDEADAGGAGDLGTRIVQAGPVEVRMAALILDRSGAAFRVKFDTHTVPLDLDPASAARLRVGRGRPVSRATWTGSGPGGHHREGTLRFATPVRPGADVELRITGLSRDAVGTWTAPLPNAE